MTTREDLESYLLRMGLEHQEVEEGMWAVASMEAGAPLVIHYSPPVVVLRLKMMTMPAEMEESRLLALFRRLLELNAADIVHGSYGLDGDEVVLSDALELEGLDYAHLQTSVESLTFAASSHRPELERLVPVAQQR
jgi:hypothetical protein